MGSGKPDASIQGESLGQEASNDTSSMRIGPAVPPTLPLITPILIRFQIELILMNYNPIWVGEGGQ